MRKNQNTKPPHLPSPRSRGRSVSRKRSIRGKSNHGAILRLPCRYYLKGTCTRTPCEYWHPPEFQIYKHKRVAKPGISVCSRIKRLMNNQTKSQRKATIHTKEEKATTRMLWLLKFVPQLGCVSQDSEALVSQRGNSTGEPDAKKSWDRFEEYDALSLHCVKQVSKKRKDHRLEKHKSKILISEVLTL